VLRFTDSHDCRMAALVRHFGDVVDADRPCGHCDVCDPAGAVLRLFRRANARERQWVQDVIEALRGTAYKTPKGLRGELPWAESLDRNDFEALLGAMLRAGLIAAEDAEFEKDGRVIPYRKISLTDAGFEVRERTPLELLFSDGMVEEFGSATAATARKKKGTRSATRGAASPVGSAISGGRGPERASNGSAGAPRILNQPAATRSAEPIVLEGDAADLAARLKGWRASEAKRLGVPAFLVLHDRTLNALAAARPASPHELLAIEGMGPSKVGRFGEAILALCCE